MGALRAIALVGLFVALYLLSAVVSYYGMLFYAEWQEYQLRRIGPWNAVPLTNREFLAAAIWRYEEDPLNPPGDEGAAYLDGLPALVRSKGYWPWYGPYEWVENESGVYAFFTPTWTGADLFIESCWGSGCLGKYRWIPGANYIVRELDSVLVRPYVHLTFSASPGYPNGYLEIGYLIDLWASVEFDGDTERISFPATLKAALRYNISGWAWRKLDEPVLYMFGPYVRLIERNKTMSFVYWIDETRPAVRHDVAKKMIEDVFMAWCNAFRAVKPELKCVAREVPELRPKVFSVLVGNSYCKNDGCVSDYKVSAAANYPTLAHEFGHVFGLDDLYYTKTFTGDIYKLNRMFGRSFSYRIGADTIMMLDTWEPEWVFHQNQGVTLADVLTTFYGYYDWWHQDWILPDYTVANKSFGLFACLPVFVGTEGDDGILSAFFGAPIVFFTRDGVHNGTTAQVRLFEYMARYGKEHGMCGSLNDVLKDWREKRVVNWAVWGWDYKHFTTPWGLFRTIMLGVYDSKAPRPWWVS